MSLALLVRVRLGRKAVVRTLHNTTPHEEPGRLGAWQLGRWESLTGVTVTLFEQPGPGQRVNIPHGSYLGAYDFDFVSAPEPDRLLHFGRIRPYKGVEALVRLHTEGAAGEVPWTLRVAGRPTTDKLRSILEGAASHGSISGLLRYVTDDEIVTELARARVVVLPHTEMENSGSLLLALSARRPVIAPRTSSTQEIAAEVGPGWVHLFEGQLTLPELTRCWHQALASEMSRGTSPDPSSRKWSRLSALYADAYRTLVAK